MTWISLVSYTKYALYKEKVNQDDFDFVTNLLQYDITEGHFLKVSRTVELLLRFYVAKLANTTIRNAVAYRINYNHTDKVKFCLQIGGCRLNCVSEK